MNVTQIRSETRTVVKEGTELARSFARNFLCLNESTLNGIARQDKFETYFNAAEATVIPTAAVIASVTFGHHAGEIVQGILATGIVASCAQFTTATIRKFAGFFIEGSKAIKNPELAEKVAYNPFNLFSNLIKQFE